MSGIYIKGIEMPTKGNPIGVLIYPDGTVEWPARDVIGTAVPVPDHGRLIDADALIIALETQDYSGAPDTLEEWTPMDMTEVEIGDIRNAPTIIPASEEDGI